MLKGNSAAPNVQFDGQASSKKAAQPEIMRRGAFALWSLAFAAVLWVLWLLQHVMGAGVYYEVRGVPVHPVTGAFALVPLGIFVCYAVAPRVRDIGIPGIAVWVVIALAFALPETTASWAVLLLYPSYVPPVFGQKA